MTGLANVNFFTKLSNIKVSKEKVHKKIQEFNLEGAKHRKILTYSGGMKRKLSLMISLFSNSKYFLGMSQQFGIDPVQKQDFWKNLNILKENNKTIIVTTHVID